jgi:CheY-like chemotaxis protein
MSHPCDKILVVDDDDGLLEAIRDVLTEEGIKVATATSAERALQVLAEGFAPDVILLDLLMPGMGVEEMLEALRSNPSYSNIPVVLTTGTPRLFTRISGADALLPKPYDPATLSGVLAEMC